MLIPIILFLLILTLLVRRTTFSSLNNVEIVISRYNEHLDWINTEPFNEYPIIVYNKGTNNNFLKSDNIKEIIDVPNVGKIDHTILYHVISHYDNLADITIFLPGSTNMSNKIEKAKEIISEVKKRKTSVYICTKNFGLKELYDFSIDSWKTSYIDNKNDDVDNEMIPSQIRPFGKWYEKHFGDKPLDCSSYGTIFAISKKDILKEPISYYKNIISELETHPNPEVGHYTERAWASIFNLEKNSKIYR